MAQPFRWFNSRSVCLTKDPKKSYATEVTTSKSGVAQENKKKVTKTLKLLVQVTDFFPEKY
jgi:hypothetical protein